MTIKVLYEDNHIIAVFKPAGMLTQADITGDVCLMDEVKKYLKEKYKKSGNVFLGLLHRLDRNVCGIVLFAKTSKGASRLSEQFRNHTIEKIYHAVVIGKPKESRGVLVNYLAKDEDKNIVEVFVESSPDAKRAELEYEVIKSNEKFSLLKIKIKTGRSHQIRVQLADIGCPILGDTKYGAKKSLPDKSLALAATQISFKLVTKNEVKTISVPAPFSLPKS